MSELFKNDVRDPRSQDPDFLELCMQEDKVMDMSVDCRIVECLVMYCVNHRKHKGSASPGLPYHSDFANIRVMGHLISLNWGR